MAMSCTGRIQKRLANAGSSIVNSSFVLRLTSIAKAVRDSRVVSDLSRGIGRIPEVGKIIYSALVKSNDEANAVTYSAIKTNVIYYGLPVGSALAVRCALNLIPGFGGSDTEYYLDRTLKIPFTYFLLRRLFDNTLYTINTPIVYHIKNIREESLRNFNVLVPELSACLARTMARKGFESDFNVLAQRKINEALLKYFEKPETFRAIVLKRLDKQAQQNLEDSFHVILNNQACEIGSSNIAKELSAALVKVIFARLVPGFAKTFNENDEVIRKAFSNEIFRFKNMATKTIRKDQFADEILNCINHACKYVEKSQPVELVDDFDLVPENMGTALTTEEHCSDFRKAPPNSQLKVVFDNLLVMLAMLYLSPGWPVDFILNAEMYGRGLLDLKLGGNCEAHRSQALASMKLLSFALGAPFAATYPLIQSPFLRDAVLSLMLILWTRAELEDARPLPRNGTGMDLFAIPRSVVNKLFSIALKVAPHIEKALQDEDRRERFIVKVTNFLNSPTFDWGVALILGDTRKHLKKLDVSCAEGGFNIKVSPQAEKTKAANIIVNEVPSVKEFIEYNGSKVTDCIYYARKTRDVPGSVVFIAKPMIYVAKPLLSRYIPALLVSSFSLFFKILKKDELERIFKSLEASFERSQFAPLREDEQKAVMLVAPQDMKEQDTFYSRPPQIVVVHKAEAVVLAPQTTKQQLAQEEKKIEPKPEPNVEVAREKETEIAMADAIETILVPDKFTQESKRADSSKAQAAADAPVVTVKGSFDVDAEDDIRTETIKRLNQKARQANRRNPFQFDYFAKGGRDKSATPVPAGGVNTYPSKGLFPSTR